MMEVTLFASIPVLIVAILLAGFAGTCIVAYDEWVKRRAARALARKKEAAATVAEFCALIRQTMNKR